MFDFFRGFLEPKQKYLIFTLLIAVVILALYQLWGNAFTGGDDPFIALDKFRKGGIWTASLKQAIGQGRFYYVLPWTTSQWAYLIDSFAYLNTIKIVTDIFFFGFLFGFVRSVWGLSFALLASFITFALFNWYASDFNPFHNIPLWYQLGAVFVLAGFWNFNEQCKKPNGKFFFSFFLYFCGLLFYEIILFYAAAFPLIYYSHNKKSFHEKGWKNFCLELIRKHLGLAFFIVLYLVAYILFRKYFPSGYEGSKELNFTSIFRVLKTIIWFTFTGIRLHKPFLKDVEIAILSLIVSLLATYGLKIIFRLNKSMPPVVEETSIKPSLLAVGFFIFAPNILYGFVDKYHVWADKNYPYYLGSFFSAWALIIFITMIISHLWNVRLTDEKREKYIKFILPLFFVIVCGNYSHSAKGFRTFKIDATKWPMMLDVGSQAGEKLDNKTICTQSLIRYQDGYYIYDYWTTYLSVKLSQKINFKYKPVEDPECNWFVDFEVDRRITRLTLREIGTDLKYTSESKF